MFFKVAPTVITPDNLHSNVFVLSMLDSPVQGLYHAIERVYAPVLLDNPKWSSQFDGKLQRLLTELETGLGSAVRRQQGIGGEYLHFFLGGGGGGHGTHFQISIMHLLHVWAT